MSNPADIVDAGEDLNIRIGHLAVQMDLPTRDQCIPFPSNTQTATFRVDVRTWGCDGEIVGLAHCPEDLWEKLKAKAVVFAKKQLEMAKSAEGENERDASSQGS